MTRYIRFEILAWHGHISMRAEVYGCPGTVGRSRCPFENNSEVETHMSQP